MNSPNFWRGRRVLITGHTGFKGGWLSLYLMRLGASVFGIALPPVTKPNLFELAHVSDGVDSRICDIRDSDRLAACVKSIRPEIVIHMAAQPLVRVGYREPISTFNTNIMGTVHIIDSLRNLNSVKVALMVTTDKVYRNMECPFPYRENDTLGGHDPYSASKAASEFVISSYRDSFLKDQGVAVASVRAGNVIGGGDWSEDRLIPDAVRAWHACKSLIIRNPGAIRPWQHVLEPLNGYIKLAEKLWHHPEFAGAYNFGPRADEAASVQEVINLALAAYGKGTVSYLNENVSPYESGWLALETSKARFVLGALNRWNLVESVTRTMNWYLALHEGANARELCEEEIAEVIEK
jgi:CDP-glucose 4,6-dehydratase